MRFVYRLLPHWHQLECISGTEQEHAQATSNENKNEFFGCYPLPQVGSSGASLPGGNWRVVLQLAGGGSGIVETRAWGS